jgi:hypothetical protein
VFLVSNAIPNVHLRKSLTKNRTDLTELCSTSSEVRVNSRFSWSPSRTVPYQNLFQTADGNAGLRVEVNENGVLAVILPAITGAIPQSIAAPIVLTPNVEYELLVQYLRNGEITLDLSGYSVVTQLSFNSVNCHQTYMGNGYDGTRQFIGDATVTITFVRHNRFSPVISHSAIVIAGLILALLVAQINLPRSLFARVGIGLVVMVLSSIRVQTPVTLIFSGQSLSLANPGRIDTSRLQSGVMHIMLTRLDEGLPSAEGLEISTPDNPVFINLDCKTETLAVSIYVATGKHLTYRTQSASPDSRVNVNGIDALTVSIIRDNELQISDSRTGFSLYSRSFKPLSTSLSSRSLPFLWKTGDLACARIEVVRISIPIGISIDAQAALLSISLLAIWILGVRTGW